MQGRKSKTDFDRFRRKIINEEFQTEHQCAIETVNFLKAFLEAPYTPWNDLPRLFEILTRVGEGLISADRLLFVPGNIVKRVFHIFRLEAKNLGIQLPKTTSVHSKEHAENEEEKWTHFDSLARVRQVEKRESIGGHQNRTEEHQSDESTQLLRDNIIVGIEDLIAELETMHDEIALQAIEHIHANEIVLTYGLNDSVQKFLLSAAKQRSFEVIVAETAPSFKGQILAKRLAKGGVQVTLVSDAAVFAMMSRVNKVVIGTHSVMINGGLVAPTGAHMITLCAEAHSVPVLVLTGMYKLTPMFPFDSTTFNKLLSPMQITTLHPLDQEDQNLGSPVPAYDYVPPELVSLFVTNFGGYTPLYVYRQFKQQYFPEDHNLGEPDQE